MVKHLANLANGPYLEARSVISRQTSRACLGCWHRERFSAYLANASEKLQAMRRDDRQVGPCVAIGNSLPTGS